MIIISINIVIIIIIFIIVASAIKTRHDLYIQSQSTREQYKPMRGDNTLVGAGHPWAETMNKKSLLYNWRTNKVYPPLLLHMLPHVINIIYITLGLARI